MDVRWCLFLALCSSVSAFLFGPCYIQPNGPMNEDKTYRMTVQPSCKNDTISWNYPRGDLYVTFHPGTPTFTVCLTHGIGPMATAVYTVTPDGPERITDPQQDEPTCVKSAEGRLTIRFTQPSFQTYVIDYQYRVIV